MKLRDRKAKRKMEEAAVRLSVEKYRKSRRNMILLTIVLFLVGALSIVSPLASDLPLGAFRGGGKFGPSNGWQELFFGSIFILAAAYAAYSCTRIKKPNQAIQRNAYD